MINNKSEKWKNAPWWVSIGLIGIKTKESAIIALALLLVFGLTYFLSDLWGRPINDIIIIAFSIYLGLIVWLLAAFQWVDERKLW